VQCFLTRWVILVMCVTCVSCFSVVPLSPGKPPFAVKIIIICYLVSCVMDFSGYFPKENSVFN
jgi:hypothetical protein